MKAWQIAILMTAVSATPAAAQSLNDILGTLTGHMRQANTELDATNAALGTRDIAGACQHLAADIAALDAANQDLDTMQATLNADTVLSDSARADWQYHINDARGSVAQLAASGRDTQAKYCS